jgi:hypothetical protein
MATHKKNTLLQAALGNAETKAFKRVFFSATQENFFPSLPFLMKLFSPTHGLFRNPTVTAFNINHYLDSFVLILDSKHHWTDRRASGNSGFAKKRVQWLNEHSTSHQILWYVDSFVLRNPLLRKAAKRYRSV